MTLLFCTCTNKQVFLNMTNTQFQMSHTHTQWETREKTPVDTGRSKHHTEMPQFYYKIQTWQNSCRKKSYYSKTFYHINRNSVCSVKVKCTSENCCMIYNDCDWWINSVTHNNKHTATASGATGFDKKRIVDIVRRG